MMTFRRNEVIQNFQHRLRDMTADWCSIKTQEFCIESILNMLFAKLVHTRNHDNPLPLK